MKDGYKIEYDNEDQVCIIPNPRISVKDLCAITKVYVDLGYKWWLPADERNGLILSKKQQAIK